MKCPGERQNPEKDQRRGEVVDLTKGKDFKTVPERENDGPEDSLGD